MRSKVKVANSVVSLRSVAVVVMPLPWVAAVAVEWVAVVAQVDVAAAWRPACRWAKVKASPKGAATNRSSTSLAT